ncbi:MAG: peptide MFS transporter [Planctomycetes bacterium]|nr:peptide MFS transporter [Planctomycetota bacterium]
MSNSIATRERHPKGLMVLFFAEMWERFSFYLMLGMLPLYLTDSQKGGLGLNSNTMAIIVGTYMGLVYFTPFIGGLLADRLLGYRFTILIGGVLMMIGHLVLALPTEMGLYLGLGFIILGNGGFKPNISTLLGNLYPPGSKLRDTGYSIFYVGINLGSFLCNIVAAIVRNYFDNHPLQITSNWTIGGWHAAFTTAAFGMLLGLVVFCLFYRMFRDADQKKDVAATSIRLTPLWVQCLAPAFALAAVFWFLAARNFIPLDPPTAAFLGACLPVIAFFIRIWRDVPGRADRDRVGALLVVFGVAVIFWGVFQLSTTALPTWARDNTDRVPGPIAQRIVDLVPPFAENAPPGYFANAGPDTARPARETFVVVDEGSYEELKKEKKLNVKTGEKVYVTQEMLDDIERSVTNDTPRLVTYEHLRLVNPELFNSINAGYVILLTPLVVAFFGWLRLLGKEPSTPGKIGLGLLLIACGPLVMLGATYVSNDGYTKATAWWLFGTYAMNTLGELCLSPMGLSLVSKLSPANIRAFMMGGWFLASSFGGKLSGVFGQLYFRMDHYVFWPILSAALVATAIMVFALLPWFKRSMGQEREAEV